MTPTKVIHKSGCQICHMPVKGSIDYDECAFWQFTYVDKVPLKTYYWFHNACAEANKLLK